ncbi:MAG: family 10 glycosylhydrolase [Sedimentisphaerales bacterium]|nr:family 10 glycosylhydrolase [Sedimentisphaerales bacterium]
MKMKKHIISTVQQSLILGVLLFYPCISGLAKDDAHNDKDAVSSASELAALRQARDQAKHRQRRIIMNNDGNDFHLLGLEGLDHPEKFLERRTTPLLDSQVDSIFYCTGLVNMYSNPMAECEPRNSRWFKSELMAEMKKRDIDPLKMMIALCRQYNKEIFWSMRMNDTHDASNAILMAQWKKDHPEYLVGAIEDRAKMTYGGSRWSSLDYNHPEVRDKVYRILEEICRRYDVDGVELDFFRHPVIYKEQMYGRDISQDQCDLMTDLIRRIRKMTEQEGIQRGKPILIAVRIPDSLGFCKALGLDLEQWLREGLIDIMASGDYFKLEPWENLAALGKKFDVAVYAGLERCRMQKIASGAEGPTDLKIWRGEAYQAWKAGVDGIYTFNRFDPQDKIFWEIGDPRLLETLERTDQTVFVNPNGWSKPQTWLKDGQTYLKDK